MFYYVRLSSTLTIIDKITFYYLELVLILDAVKLLEIEDV